MKFKVVTISVILGITLTRNDGKESDDETGKKIFSNKVVSVCVDIQVRTLYLDFFN